jgi:hypothetical protein
VWCAISRKIIVGPVFFENTVNSQEYLRILQEFIPQLDEEEINECYYQQDGASCHTSQFIAPHLMSYFGDRIISRSNRYLKTATERPPRSPDLTEPDFFLWAHLKNNVYSTNPQTIEELKINIENEIKKISVETLERVSDNMIKRVKLCRFGDCVCDTGFPERSQSLTCSASNSYLAFSVLFLSVLCLNKNILQ